jgi:CRISPR-associated protein Csx16
MAIIFVTRHLGALDWARGARYLNLSLDLPANLRGRELDAPTLAGLNARLEEYVVRRIGA